MYSMNFVKKVLKYRQTHGALETVEHFKIAPSTLFKWIRKYGHEYGLSMVRESKTAEVEEDIQMMRALRNDGMTLEEIGAKFDRSMAYVHQHTTKPTDLMSASAFVDAVKSGNMPTQKTRIMIKNKIVGTFVPE
jgi:hypothetical protein